MFALNYDLHPLMLWLHAHPDWALSITFLISLAESLAIVGSLIPGSLVMTAVGILAGSGIMRIDLTLVAATLGAIAGDGVSYMLGHTFRDRLTHIWPFSRYPQWLKYGKTYFSQHGGKSVLIGRFFGPLRSIIPVIAGMMNMRRWHFFLANITSAIGWACLYVLPGVFIGQAGSDLPADTATHFFTLIWILLIVFLLLNYFIRRWYRRRQDNKKQHNLKN